MPWLNIALLVISAILIFWYAKEARRQAEAMMLNNDVQLVPYFSIVFELLGSESSEQLARPFIINIGKGIATNVKIGLAKKPKAIPKDVDLELNVIPSFKSEHKKELTNQFFWGDANIPNINLAWGDFTRKENPLELDLNIIFENIFGHKYSQIIKIDKNGVSPQKIEKSR